MWKFLMSCNVIRLPADRRWLVGGVLLAILLTGCATTPSGKSRASELGPEAALSYNQGLSRMTAAELGRERMVLVAVPQTPYTHLRMAMLLGHPRVQQDLGKATSLLDGILKSTDPAALALHPLARLLADNYAERVKLDGQLEKQGGQLKESQRKAAELQEKLDGLADIERTLTPRPGSARPPGGKR